MTALMPAGHTENLAGGIHPLALRQQILEIQRSAGYSSHAVSKVADLFYGSRIIDRLTEQQLADLAQTLTTIHQMGWSEETLHEHMNEGLAERFYIPPAASEPDTPLVVPDDLEPAANLTVPATLPVRSLSPSSIETWIGCREQWRRRYIDKETDPKSLPMVAGTAVGNTLAQIFVSMRDGQPITPKDADDILLGEWDLATNDDIDFGDTTSDGITTKRENARLGIESFYTEVLPEMAARKLEVIEVEREVRFSFPNTNWHVKGFLDVLTRTGNDTPIFDVKWGARHKSAGLALRGIQPRLYMAGRYLETGHENQQFQFITGKDQLPKRGGNHWACVPTFDQPARQTLHGHIRLLERVALVAREIARCHETGDWDYADPDNWRCSPKFCSAYHTCPGGGLDLTH